MTNLDLPSILVVDDDEDDCENIRAAFVRGGIANQISFVNDGSEMLDFLLCQGKYTSAAAPALILLDLNMPRTDGRDSLRLLKANGLLCRIPVVVLTTSKDGRDVSDCYELGASSFISKPASFEGLVVVVRALRDYWLQIVELPAPIPIASWKFP